MYSNRDEVNMYIVSRKVSGAPNRRIIIDLIV